MDQTLQKLLTYIRQLEDAYAQAVRDKQALEQRVQEAAPPAPPEEE